jgi:hypothetical protein
VKHLRESEEHPLFKSRRNMFDYYLANTKQHIFGSIGGEAYGFKIKTKSYTYYTRYFPNRGDYNAYIFAYNDQYLQAYLENGETEEKNLMENELNSQRNIAKEVIARSLREKNYIDMDFISKELGKSLMFEYVDTIKFLREQGLVYLNVGYAETQEKTYVTADEYLSGYLTGKLQSARAAAKTLPEYDYNVKALEKALEEKNETHNERKGTNQ